MHYCNYKLKGLNMIQPLNTAFVINVQG